VESTKAHLWNPQRGIWMVREWMNWIGAGDYSKKEVGKRV